MLSNHSENEINCMANESILFAWSRIIKILIPPAPMVIVNFAPQGSQTIFISYITITHSVHKAGSRKKETPHIRNKSQFSYKIMNKTIGYCSKTTGCTRKSGFLFAGTHCKGSVCRPSLRNLVQTYMTIIVWFFPFSWCWLFISTWILPFLEFLVCWCEWVFFTGLDPQQVIGHLLGKNQLLVFNFFQLSFLPTTESKEPSFSFFMGCFHDWITEISQWQFKTTEVTICYCFINVKCSVGNKLFNWWCDRVFSKYLNKLETK